MNKDRWAEIIAARGPWYVRKLSFRLDAPPGETRLAMGLFSTEAEAWDYLKCKSRDDPARRNDKNLSGMVIDFDWSLLDGGPSRRSGA